MAYRQDPTVDDVNRNQLKKLDLNDSDSGLICDTDERSSGQQLNRHKKKVSAFFGVPNLTLSVDSDSDVTSQQSTINLMGQELD